MALYETPWGRRELPEDEAAQLRGQVGVDGITEVPADSTQSAPGVVAVEGYNPNREGK